MISGTRMKEDWNYMGFPGKNITKKNSYNGDGRLGNCMGFSGKNITKKYPHHGDGRLGKKVKSFFPV